MASALGSRDCFMGSGNQLPLESDIGSAVMELYRYVLTDAAREVTGSLVDLGKVMRKIHENCPLPQAPQISFNDFFGMIVRRSGKQEVLQTFESGISKARFIRSFAEHFVKENQMFEIEPLTTEQLESAEKELDSIITDRFDEITDAIKQTGSFASAYYSKTESSLSIGRIIHNEIEKSGSDGLKNVIKHPNFDMFTEVFGLFNRQNQQAETRKAILNF